MLSGDPVRAHKLLEKLAAEARDGMTMLNSQWERSLELMGHALITALSLPPQLSASVTSIFLR